MAIPLRLEIDGSYLAATRGSHRQFFSAYVPDLPACVATGSTELEAEEEIRSAIAFHIEGLRENG
ncbi:MAG: type II toxin-antitoxin system HicB family antitoxin [Burkholderiales bacterium]